MNFLELTKARYSCRDYQPTSVEKEKLDYIMECVRFAPSAVNKQPWRFHIVTSEEDKAKLTQCCTTKNGSASMASAMAILTSPLPWNTFVWLLRSRDWQPVGFATSTPISAWSSLACLRMKSLP